MVNPAVAGTERYAPLMLSTRQQWIGWEGAPGTQSVTFHTRLRAKSLFYTPQGFRNKGKNSFGKIGVGGGFFNYTYGAVSHMGVHLDYAYHVFVGNGRLAMGLAPIFFQYRLNKSNFTMPDSNIPDPLLEDPTEVFSFLDANAGLHYYQDNFYLGLSVIQLLNSSVKFGDYSFPKTEDPSENPDLARTLYLYSGMTFELSRDMILEPSVYLKFNARTGIRFDVNTQIVLQERFFAGVSYRFLESAGLLAGVRLDNMQVRYLFEIPLSSQIPNRFSNHSIGIGFNIGQPIE